MNCIKKLVSMLVCDMTISFLHVQKLIGGCDILFYNGCYKVLQILFKVQIFNM